MLFILNNKYNNKIIFREIIVGIHLNNIITFEHKRFLQMNQLMQATSFTWILH